MFFPSVNACLSVRVRCVCLCGTIFGGCFVLFCLNFVEVGFDSPAKLATGVPPFKVNPLLWHCTSSALSGIRRYVREPLHSPYWGAARSP